MKALAAQEPVELRPLGPPSLAWMALPFFGFLSLPLLLTAVFPMFGMPLGMFAMLMYILYIAKRGASVREAMQSALLHYQAGRLHEAHAELKQLVRFSSGLHVQDATSRFNLARVKLRLGQPREAQALVEPLLHDRWFELHALCRQYPRALATAALSCALQGKLEKAQRWLDEGQRRLDQPNILMLLPAEVITHIRRGELQRAIEHLDTHRSGAEAVFGAHQLRVLRLLRLFAVYEQGDHYRRPALVPVGQLHAGSLEGLEYLWSHWPDLARFVDELRERPQPIQ